MPNAHVFRRWLAAAALAAAGCSAGEGLHGVAGNVTLAGAPVASGRVYFTPDPARGGRGPQGFADVRGGRFDTARGGRGTAGGPVLVRVECHDPTGLRLAAAWEGADDLPAGRAERSYDLPASSRLTGPPAEEP